MAKYKKRKDGRYATTILIGYNDEGKPILKPIYGKTISELELKKSQVLVDLDRKIYVSNRSVTFKEYSERWIETKKISVTKQTIYMYESIFNNHINTLNDTYLIDITKQDIQDIINRAAHLKRTCQKIKITLNQIFESAIDENLLYKNPARGITLPKYKAEKKRKLTASEEILTEQTEFNNTEKMLITLLKYYGLRKEEVVALSKSDFDFTSEQFTIARVVEYINNKPSLKGTKSEAGERSLYILNQHLELFMNYINDLESNYLFSNKNKLLTDSQYRKLFNGIIKKMTSKAKELKINAPDNLTSHIFRHNYATMLHYAGVKIKDAQYLLGHSTATVTMDIYTHLDKENTDSRDKINDYIKYKINLNHSIKA